MDVTRRDNDRKVLAVKVQMQELMVVFFESVSCLSDLQITHKVLCRLRHIRDSQEKGRDGVSVADRLKHFMLEVASDIKKCGSACDAYLKKGFLGGVQSRDLLPFYLNVSNSEDR